VSVRILVGQINLPPRWMQMSPADLAKGYLLVQLDPNSEEYKKVETHLKSTGTVTKIVKVSYSVQKQYFCYELTPWSISVIFFKFLISSFST
jgi:hypothetical protein